jgi:hypothetical protein
VLFLLPNGGRIYLEVMDTSGETKNAQWLKDKLLEIAVKVGVQMSAACARDIVSSSAAGFALFLTEPCCLPLQHLFPEKKDKKPRVASEQGAAGSQGAASSQEPIKAVIKARLLGTVMDGTNTNILAGKMLEEELSTSVSLTCAVHSWNLVYKDFCNVAKAAGVAKVMDRACKAASHINENPSTRHIVNTFQVHLGGMRMPCAAAACGLLLLCAASHQGYSLHFSTTMCAPQEEVFKRTYAFDTHCETRFASKGFVLRSVIRSKNAFKVMLTSNSWKEHSETNAKAAEIFAGLGEGTL